MSDKQLYTNNKTQKRRFKLVDAIKNLDMTGVNFGDTLRYDGANFIPAPIQTNDYYCVMWGGNVVEAGAKYVLNLFSAGDEAQVGESINTQFVAPYKSWIDSISISKQDKLNQEFDFLKNGVRLFSIVTEQNFCRSYETNRTIETSFFLDTGDTLSIKALSIAPSDSIAVNLIVIFSKF